MRLLSAGVIYNCLVSDAGEQGRWHTLFPQVMQGRKK